MFVTYIWWIEKIIYLSNFSTVLVKSRADMCASIQSIWSIVPIWKSWIKMKSSKAGQLFSIFSLLTRFAVSIQLIAKELENIMLVMPHCLWASERMLSTTSLFKMSWCVLYTKKYNKMRVQQVLIHILYRWLNTTCYYVDIYII